MSSIKKKTSTKSVLFLTKKERKNVNKITKMIIDEIAKATYIDKEVILETIAAYINIYIKYFYRLIITDVSLSVDEQMTIFIKEYFSGCGKCAIYNLISMIPNTDLNKEILEVFMY